MQSFLSSQRARKVLGGPLSQLVIVLSSPWLSLFPEPQPEGLPQSHQHLHFDSLLTAMPCGDWNGDLWTGSIYRPEVEIRCQEMTAVENRMYYKKWASRTVRRSDHFWIHGECISWDNTMEEGTDRCRMESTFQIEGGVWTVPGGDRWLSVHGELHLPREQSEPRPLQK